jgi:hypothetical protein
MVVTCKFAAFARGGYRRLTQTIAGALLHAQLLSEATCYWH